MAHTLTDADTYSATVTVPDDGDTLSAASVETGFQNLADRTNFLANRNVAAGGVPSASRIYIPTVVFGQGGTPKWKSSNKGWYLLQESTVSSTSIAFDVPHLPGAKFSEIRADVSGAPTGYTPRGGEPATKFTLELFRRDAVFAALGAAFASQEDPETVAGNYETDHTVALTFAQQTMDDTYQYRVNFVGETGAFAEANSFAVLRCYLILDDQT